MRKLMIGCVLAGVMTAGSAMATVLWLPSVTNGITPPDTGDWGDYLNWRNTDTNLPYGDRFMLPDDPANVNGKAAFPVENEAECVVSDFRNVGKLVLGDNGLEDGSASVLRIVSNAVLNASELGTWTGIGYNRPAICIVEEGGVLNCQRTSVASGGDHLWVGLNPGSHGTLEINGGTVTNGQMLGLGWGGGIGFININNNGTLVTTQMHGDGNQSVQNGSLINITYTDTNKVSGRLVYPASSGITNLLATYVANGHIVANGKAEDVIISYDTNLNAGVVTAVPAPPDPPLWITAVDTGGGALDIEWSGIPGKQFDLLSSENLAIPVDTWPIYNDGVTTYENIPNSVTGTNSLTGILPTGGPPRFFVVRKEFGDGISLFAEDFDAGSGLPAGWTSGTNVADTGTTSWEVGAPTNVGPAAANSLSNCAATGIAANYGATSDIWLRSPDIDLTSAGVQSNGATLVFSQSRDIEVGADAGSLRVLRAGDLVQLGADMLNPVTGDAGAWEDAEVELPPEALGETVKLEFQFTSDAGNAYLWNSSFEEPVLANGELVDAEEGLYGWQRGRYGLPGEPFRDRDSSGVWIKNPDDLNELEFLPDGDNVGFVDGKYDWDVGIRQVLQINLESNTQYDVSVWVASSYDNGDGTIIPLPSNRVELVTGDTILAVTSEDATPAYSTWVERTLSWNSAGDTNNVFGEPLEIRLINVAIGDGLTGEQALGFDDVTLTVTPAPGPVGLAGWYIDDVEVKTPIP